MEIDSSQRDAVRAILEDANRLGWGNRRTSLNIVGRINAKTGRREGGVIGLTRRETGAVNAARAELEAGNPNYFTRKLRNRTFDPMVRRAFKDKGRLSPTNADKIAGKYSDRLLFERGRRIARTEVRQATGAGAEEGMRQVLDTGALRANQIRKVWHATPDSRTRDSHILLDGVSVGMDEVFQTNGSSLRFPGDMSLGAKGEDVINCRCWPEFRVDYFVNEGG